jgi:hypothetical protein
MFRSTKSIAGLQDAKMSELKLNLQNIIPAPKFATIAFM